MKPTVELMGKMHMENTFKNKYIQPKANGPYSDGSSGETIVEFAGRVCYDSHEKGRASVDYHENIIASKHYSVMEHMCFGFFFTSISVACTHELVRHRHLSPSQRSTRYCDPMDEPAGLDERPDGLGHEEWSEVKHMILVQYERACGIYHKILEYIKTSGSKMERKTARGIARKVMPVSTPTEIVMTGNVRAWREFCQKRDVPIIVDAEIQLLANQVLKILKEHVPHLVSDMEPT